MGLPFNQIQQIKLADKRVKDKDKRARLSSEREKRKEDINNTTEGVKNSTDQPKGLAKFTPIILEKGSHIVTTMVPALVGMVEEYFESDISTLQENLENVVAPSQKEIQDLIIKLNGVIDDLNQTANFLTQIIDISTPISTGIEITQQVSSILKYSIPVVSTAAKTTPLIPGIVVSLLDDLDWINNNLLYKNDGTPKLPGVNAGVNGITSSTAIVSITINKVVPIIESLIKLIEKFLGPINFGGDEINEYTLNSLNSNVKTLSELGNSNFDEQDPVTYNGFIIRVETIPFTPTVNRYQAVGFNTYGVPMIRGELSFSSNALILINELKFIIDRDNLKAY